MRLEILTRRRFLLLGTLSALIALAGGLLSRLLKPARDLSPLSESEQALLTRYLDLLIPADESPGALDLGVHTKLFARASGNDYLRDLLHRGCVAMESHARQLTGSGFVALEETHQFQLISLSENAQPDTVEYRLFEHLRHFAFRDYYGNARSWSGLEYQGPPQPLGFPDYHKPPETGRHG